MFLSKVTHNASTYLIAKHLGGLATEVMYIQSGRKGKGGSESKTPFLWKFQYNIPSKFSGGYSGIKFLKSSAHPFIIVEVRGLRKLNYYNVSG